MKGVDAGGCGGFGGGVVVVVVGEGGGSHFTVARRGAVGWGRDNGKVQRRV